MDTERQPGKLCAIPELLQPGGPFAVSVVISERILNTRTGTFCGTARVSNTFLQSFEFFSRDSVVNPA